MRIGFCGTGMMGGPMAVRLVEAGHDVKVWNRTAAKADAVVERGAARAGLPAGRG
jgi:3-hydroxyisobutyrate dehydrogenase-like beta-hydroxyacid dehydrogenase